MADKSERLPTPRPSRKLKIADLVRPHWKALTIAMVAVLGETITDVAAPWPIKVVVDNVVQSKKLPGWIGAFVASHFGHNKFATLNFAVAAVEIIAVVGAVSSYLEKYMTTTVSQWVAHDLRRTLYNHIQRLSLAEYDKERTADLISRVTSDIEAVQDFINSALLGIVVDVLTLVGMIGVMLILRAQLAVHSYRSLGGAAAFSGGVLLHAAHQEGFASCAQERERDALGGAGGVDLDSRRQSFRAGGLRTAQV